MYDGPISNYLVIYRMLHENYEQKSTAYIPPPSTTPAYDRRGHLLATEVTFTLIEDVQDYDGPERFGGQVVTEDTEVLLESLSTWSRYAITIAAGSDRGYGPATDSIVLMTGEYG